MVSLINIAYGVFVFFFFMIAVVIIFQIWKKSHNYKVRIRRLTSNNTKITRDAYGKVKRDKNNVPYLKIWFGIKNIFKKPLPNKLPMPSADVVEFDSADNKMVVEAWYDDIRGYTYIKDPINIDNLNELKGTDGFRVFPTNHREMMIHQMMKKDASKPKQMSEVIMYMTPFLALLMILTVFLIFFGKAVQPITDAAEGLGEKIIEMEKIQADTASQINTMVRNLDALENGKPLERVISPPEV